MNNSLVQNHMKNRMYWLYSIFGFSLYNCYHSSLYETIEYNPYSLISINCYLFLSYICWDIFKMIFTPGLYRNDLHR